MLQLKKNQKGEDGVEYSGTTTMMEKGKILTKTTKLKTVKISSSISQDDVTWLTMTHKPLELSPIGENITLHPMAAASRSIHREIVAREIEGGLRVLGVGTNPSAWPMDGFVHSLPYIEPRDGGRRMAQHAWLTRQEAEGYRVETTSTRLEQLQGKFNIIIAMHSAYNISLPTLLLNAYRLKAKVVYVTILSSLNLLTEASGILFSEDASFLKYKVGDKVRIKFPPLTETGDVYDHDWHNYQEHLLARRFRVSDNLTYVGDILYQKGECVTIKWVLVDTFVEQVNKIQFIEPSDPYMHSIAVRCQSEYRFLPYNFGRRKFICVPNYIYTPSL